MANITTEPFSYICKKMGADIIFSPMISSNAICYNPNKTLEIIKYSGKIRPFVIQIFGYDPKIMAKAALIIDTKIKPDGIDINMGCPAQKITGNDCGSALLKNLPKALEIFSAVRKIYSGQLSVKLRLGWNDFNILPFVKELENRGVDAVVIHGRTVKQGYSGMANWDAIEQVASNATIPVIGNGDITSLQNTNEKIKKYPKLAGIMIGRGSLGNPWIFKEINEQKVIVPTKTEIAQIIDLHAKETINFLKNEKRACSEMRKHLGWYIKNFPCAQEIRKKAMLVENYEDIKNILKLINLEYNKNKENL